MMILYHFKWFLYHSLYQKEGRRMENTLIQEPLTKQMLEQSLRQFHQSVSGSDAFTCELYIDDGKT